MKPILLKYCKQCQLSIDDVMLLALDVVNNHPHEVFTHIYTRERAQHPDKTATQIKHEMADKFSITYKKLESYLYPT